MQPGPVRQLRLHGRRRQQGQALLYGLFTLMAALTALFFLFNTGQLASEKTKLVNTADAVAYSAGIMHARALNFDAYTNRALLANEVAIAQLVSMASWTQYTQTHANNVPPLNCLSYYSVPVALGLTTYALACAAISPYAVRQAISSMNSGLQSMAETMTATTELAKTTLQASQGAMFASLYLARARLMQEVADANYDGDGAVHVDTAPLVDNFFLFEGEPFIKPHSGAQRERFKEVAVLAAYRDDFVEERRWTSRSLWPCTPVTPPGADFKRRGGTEMIGMDEWKAMDTSSLHLWHYHISITGSGCKHDGEIPLGYAGRAAANDPPPPDHGASYGGSNDNPVAKAIAMASTVNWNYSGLPTFFELTQAARNYTPGNADPAKRDPRVGFSIRLTRAKSQLKTSDGRADIKPAGRLHRFQGSEASGVMAAVATSEVFFERPDRFDASRTSDELASLFNPFWQVRLSTTSAQAMALALTKGGQQ